MVEQLAHAGNFVEQSIQELTRTEGIDISCFNHKEEFDLKAFLKETSQKDAACAELFQQLHQILEDK
jgi:hypothetical protein